MSQLTCTEHFVINNERGLHARPAALFVQVASAFSSSVDVFNEDTQIQADGKSVMSMLMLAAPQGTNLRVTITGEDAPLAMKELGNLICRGFDE